ncbi:hypothetical protein SDC9_208448 [bioreactor metagenome]|uniref:Uncharacterized protein n=1 Tax=bioreactor metagenome TaxID=1076179 RepID=A0A645JBK8_9ZZZZ
MGDFAERLFRLPVERVERFQLFDHLVQLLPGVLAGVFGGDSEGEFVADFPRLRVERGEDRPVEQVVGVVAILQEP